LKRIREADNALEIGAAVRLSEAYAQIVSRYPCSTRYSTASVHRRSAIPATLCGNIANGSPDRRLDAGPDRARCYDRVALRRAHALLPAGRSYLGYQKKALARGELVARCAYRWPDKAV